MKSLPFVALLILQELELRLRFHALGNDPLLQFSSMCALLQL